MAIDTYQQAARINKKSLGELIRENAIGGDMGALKSVRSAISDKMAAKSKGFKEKFDYLNIVRMLMGNTMSALVGRATGRKQEDIAYFANKGVKNKKGKAKQADDRYTGGKKVGTLDTALYTSISDGQKQKLRKGDGVADVLARLYNLMKGEFVADKKRLQIERNFKKQKEKDKDKWHKELLEALSKRGKGTATPVAEKKEGFNLLDFIKKIFENVAAMIEKVISSVAKAIWSSIKFLGKGLATVAEMVGLKKLADKALDKIGNKTKVDEPKKETQKFTKEQEKALDKEYGKKVEKTAEKEVEKKLEKAGIKGAAKSAGKSILKKLPFGLGLAAAGYFAYDRLKEGDIVGAGLELASGAAAIVPVVGTAASMAIDAVSIGRDLKKSTMPATEAPAAPTATPAPAESSPITTRAQSAISENLNMKNEEFTGTQNIVVDASKKVNSVGNGGQGVLLDKSVNVRTDDTTLQKVLKQNLRPV